ncbi:hypothetical protein GCM10011419_20790 [Vogesella fluminis]|uniref:Uncharacterized protein n=1 Tax=Vogesella fluminis TaxID=1069161 RepID=A0ABQ3HA73_9NEIS|nr:hypothetical protein GCM10011419_20790 [Vogesella fluminis]
MHTRPTTLRAKGMGDHMGGRQHGMTIKQQCPAAIKTTCRNPHHTIPALCRGRPVFSGTVRLYGGNHAHSRD